MEQNQMRLAVIVILSAAMSCQAPSGGSGTDNPENCVLNGQLCAAPDKACNPTSGRCEPAIQLMSVSPARASNQGGQTVTLSGKRLTADLAVLFAGVPATISGVTPGPDSDQLSVVVPANLAVKGKVAIELVHPEGQRQQWADLFAYYSAITFTETRVSGYSDPRGVFGGDFNGDGRLDIALCDNFSQKVYVLLGKGDGTLDSASALSTPVGLTPQYCARGDLNGDGKPDFLVLNSGTRQLQTLLNNGSGTLQAQALVALADMLVNPVLADLNRDGKADLVAGDGTSYWVQFGDGLGGFGTSTKYSVFANASSPTVGLFDLNSDGALDLLAANSSDAYLAILYGNGQGGFALPATQLVLTQPPRHAVAADFNMDGHPDLVVSLNGSIQFSFILSKSDGSFDNPRLVTIQNQPTHFAAVDLNGDGPIDLAWVSSYASKNFGSYVGLGDGSLVSPQMQTEGMGPAGFVVGDLNGDDKPDVVIFDRIARQLRILRNSGL